MKSGYGCRPRFPLDEQRLRWLPMLLEAGHVIDKGVEAALKRARRLGRRLACRKGCGSCCRVHRDIPVYPIELAGIIWYCTEKIEGQKRQRLKERLMAHTSGGPCPFLDEDSCGIHPLRPAACRQFNVLDTPCAPGEDPFHTRRGDVLAPSAECTERAFAATLAFYGLQDAPDRLWAARHVINTQHVNLVEYEWKRLASVMERLEGQKARKEP